MKKIIPFLLIVFCSIVIWHSAFSVFFTQDDFILINEFSQNSFSDNLKNIFGPPHVTHWRPVYSLVFLISGKVFYKNFFGYHFLIFLVHLSIAFIIFKVADLLFKNSESALTAALIYVTNSSHFVSLFWISGSATSVGFLAFILSFYFYLKKRALLSIPLFFISLLASEAMVVGVAIFAVWEMFSKKKLNQLPFLALSLISALFLFVRYYVFTPKITFEIYKLEIGFKTISSALYYFLRILGFAEVSGDNFVSGILLLFLFLIFFILLKNFRRIKNSNLFLFFVLVCFIGLFPFVLIPSHISAHYMNVSIWGFSMICAFIIARQRSSLVFLLCGLFLTASFLNVNLIGKTNWVVMRSEISKNYIHRIEEFNAPKGSLLIFKDSSIASSKEAYISLGTGDALKFWFRERNYKGCFSFFENCQIGKDSFEIN